MSEVNWNHNRQAQVNILDAVGRTPVVRLQRVSADICVNLEYQLFEEAKHVEVLDRDRPMDPYTVGELDRYQKERVVID